MQSQSVTLSMLEKISSSNLCSVMPEHFYPTRALTKKFSIDL